MDSCNSSSTIGLGIFESIFGDTTTGWFSDQLDRLNDAGDDFVFDATVFALSVLTNGDNVDVIIEGLVAFYRSARSNVGVEREDSVGEKIDKIRELVENFKIRGM